MNVKVILPLFTILILLSTCKEEEPNDPGIPCPNEPTVHDADGNVYNTVQIGNQCWMKENLLVSAGITEVTDSQQWVNSQAPAWCYYANDPANVATYGKLYNWYAVATGNLCPTGWHTPTDIDWQILVDYLSGDSLAGGKMKATRLWDDPNTGATNSSGFTAIPSGYRGGFNGGFYDMGYSSIFWTSSDSSTTHAWLRYINKYGSNIGRWDHYKWLGYSCRCVKD